MLSTPVQLAFNSWTQIEREDEVERELKAGTLTLTAVERELKAGTLTLTEVERELKVGTPQKYTFNWYH